SRVGDALQILVDGHAAFLRLACDPACLKLEVVDLRHPTCTVNGHIRLEAARGLRIRSVNHQAIAALLDSLHPRIQVYLDAELARDFDQLADEIRIETREGTRTAVHDLHMGTGPGGNVGELERDVATTDEDDFGRQPLELQELRTAGQVLLTGDVERSALGA